VVGGGLAILSLAAAELAAGARVDGWGRSLVDGFTTSALVLLLAAVTWLPVLLATELARPRLHFDARRWATVFPLGMYAAMSFAVDRAQPHTALVHFARGWTWVALVAWFAMGAASLTRLQAHLPALGPWARRVHRG
jgi:hypothetical protein